MNWHNTKLVLILTTFLAVTVLGCSTATSPRPEAIDLQIDTQLPVRFENVWFRTEKVRLLVAYEATGTLTINSDAIVFNHKDGTIKVAADSIQRVTEGTLPPHMGGGCLAHRPLRGGGDRYARRVQTAASHLFLWPTTASANL